MQDAVGSPLPPPHQPGQGPGADWSSAAPHAGQQHPGAHPGSAPLSRPPAPVYPGGAPAGPVPQAQHPPLPQHAPVSQHAPVPPTPDTTGHMQLPQGDFVPTPGPPPATGALDPASVPLAVLLIGPAGAGKTSVAKYWAEHRRVPTAHISLDDVREWVRSGFADPQSGWNDHSEAQYRLARRTCGFAARNFLANGISCILDDAVFPDRPVVGLGGWKRHVGPGLLPVVLLPGLEVVLERNAERSGNRRLTDEEVARIHGRMAGWYGSGLPIIDNSQLDVPATARVLDDVLARLLASPPKW
ncbi:Pro-rich N-terminal domain-containing protein [Streptomyces sp. SID12501]|uniref:AAA family ATPase n=1 Tax=Streptomyces sp. SID12501 TaxID=2706042 RepID=A0A6B3BS42_9ACTN|nr:Pro-rich N-terminal domain-containing protein [Streptomyces sp. SID12501]NEC87163.1 AAA family ATPase [Streptomyces sp. SID12501]